MYIHVVQYILYRHTYCNTNTISSQYSTIHCSIYIYIYIHVHVYTCSTVHII